MAMPLLTVEPKITFLRTAHGRLFVTACSTINLLVTEYPDLQYVGTLTMDSTQETCATFSISVCPARAPTPVSPAQTGGHPTSTSEAQFMPRRSLYIVCDQSCNRPLLSFKHAMHPIYPHVNPCTNIVPLDCTSSTMQLENPYINCTETLEQQSHGKPAEDGQILPMNITHLSQQLQNLIAVHQLDSKLRTPINFRTLQTELALHPDQVFVNQLIHNLQYGCNIGYTGPQFAHCGSSNLPSSFQHPSTLDANINAECDKGRILGPFETPPLPNFRCSGLGLVPKHDGGWRAIYHLSALYGSSINDSRS